jgi:hypothetical protein
VIKGGTQYNSDANGISLGINNNTFAVGDTVEIFVYANDYADQTLYWWIVPEEGGIADPGFGSITLDGNFGTITFTVDSDDYEFRVRVSPEENNYDPESIGVESVLINGDAPTFGSDYHLHLTTGDLTETSIFLGTDDHNVRTTTDGKIQITTPSQVNKVWEFGTDGGLTLPGDIRSENAINIDINLSDSTLRRWTFGEDGDLTVPGDIATGDGESFLKDIPQNYPTGYSSGFYALQASDRGRHILIDGIEGTSIQVPTDATAPMPIGSAIVLVIKPGMYNVFVGAEDYDAMVFHGAGVDSNGAFQIDAGNGGAMATLIKIGANEWMISGTGLAEFTGP